MSALPGWYPDPAGSSELRLWDGAAWTSQLRPAPQGEAIIAQAGSFSESHEITASVGDTATASYFLPVTPATQAGAHDGSSFGAELPARRSHRKLITGLVLGAVVIAAAAFAVPAALSSSGSIYDRTSTAMPKSVASYSRVGEASNTAPSSASALSTPFAGATIGVYQGTGDTLGALLAVARIKSDPSRLRPILDAAKASGFLHEKDGTPSDLSNFQDVDAGPLGGLMQCGTFTAETKEAAACIFVDQGAEGTVSVVGTDIVDHSLMLKLRSAIEKRS